MAAYLVRRAVEADWSFIAPYWSDSFRRSRWAGAVPNNLWAAVREEMVGQLRARGAIAWVASAVADPDTLLAFLVCEGDVVHYLYTKAPLRRLGIANALLDAAQIPEWPLYTHRTDDARYFPGARFAPEIARRLAPPAKQEQP